MTEKRPQPVDGCVLWGEGGKREDRRVNKVRLNKFGYRRLAVQKISSRQSMDTWTCA